MATSSTISLLVSSEVRKAGMQYIFCRLRQTKNACTNFHVLSVVLGAGIVAGASYSADVAVFEPGAKHTFDEGVGKIL